MTDVDGLVSGLGQAIQDAELCGRSLRQSPIDRDQLIMQVDQLYSDVIRLVAHVMHATSLAPSSIADAPDGRLPEDDTPDRRALTIAIQGVYGHAAFLRGSMNVSEREYAVLAEYADGLHDELARLMAVLASMRALPATP